MLAEPVGVGKTYTALAVASQHASPILIVAPAVLRAAAHFRHYGEEAVGDVPVAMEGDEIAIRTFATRIERLCGMRIVDHFKMELER